jgi:hypothetical protein
LLRSRDDSNDRIYVIRFSNTINLVKVNF